MIEVMDMDTTVTVSKGGRSWAKHGFGGDSSLFTLFFLTFFLPFRSQNFNGELILIRNA